jgi:hypothetical protein
MSPATSKAQDTGGLADHAFQFGQKRSDFQHPRLQRFAAGKGQRLPHEPLGPVTRLATFADQEAELIVRHPPVEHGEGALDRRQHVIEVVRHPTHELAQSLHLLRLHQPFLGLLASGHLGLQGVRRLL